MIKRLLAGILMLLPLFSVGGCAKPASVFEQRYESERFVFTGACGDCACAQDLGEALERKLPDMEDHLGGIVDGPIRVFIFADVESFHKSTGNAQLGDWAVAKSGVNSISLVCPYYEGNPKTPEHMVTVALHELAHVVSRQANTDLLSLPAWLYEGIAGYEAADMNEANREKVKAAVQSGAIPDLEAIARADNHFLRQNGYAFSITVVEYIVETYGYPKLAAFLQILDFEAALNVSVMQFEADWKRYVMDRYR